MHPVPGDDDTSTTADAASPEARPANQPTRVYGDERFNVLWDATRCIHTANCLRGLPEVFDTRARPWISIDQAAPEEIAATIRTCPTGALRYGGTGIGPEQPDEPPTIDLVPSGPLYVRGRTRVTDADGRVVTEEHRVALCRCGASANKPFCDNSHRRIGFERPTASA